MTDDIREVQRHPLDYLLILRRRLRWFVVPMVLTLVAGALVTILWPAMYRSTTTIAVAGASVTSDLARQMDREERIRAFSQQLLAPATLSQVATLEHLTPGVPTQADLLALRQRIQISPPPPVPGSDPQQVDSYVVSYSDSSPGRAQRVAQRLADVFVAETSQVQQVRAEDTSDFLAGQLRQSKSRLDDLDARLAGAKAKYMGRLPEQTDANMQALSSLRQQLQLNNTAMRGEQDRLDLIQRQMSMMAEGATQAPGQPSTPQQRVRALETQLADARRVYTDQWPDVQRLERELAEARKEAAAVKGSSLDEQAAELQQDPAYRQLVSERDATRLRIRDLQRSSGDVAGQIGLYQQRLDGAPAVEQEMASLQRDRDLERKRFDDLTSRYNNARLTETLERKRGSQHFAVLYPASLPTEPYEPDRVRLALLTLAAALVFGAGGALGRDYLDRSVHDARTLQQEFNVRVLGEIPHIRRTA